MSMAMGEHLALYPLGYFVDRFHPRASSRTPTFLYRAHARAREADEGTHPLTMIVAVGPGRGASIPTPSP
jgi:hypothetical protein